MLKGLSRQQTIAGVVIVLVAVVGWIVAFNYQGRIGALEGDVANAVNAQNRAEADLAAAAEQLAVAEQELATATEAMGRLEEVEMALDEFKTAVGDLDGVKAQIEDGNATLAALTPEVDAKTAEVAALQEKVEALAVQAVVYETITSGGVNQYETTRTVNVRSGPSTDSDVLVVLPAGTTVEVFEAVEDGRWFKIGGVGYIFHDLIKPASE